MLLRNVSVRAETFDMAAGGLVQPGQQAQDPGLAAAVAANEGAQRRLEREIQRTKKGIARRKLTGHLMQNKRRGLRKMSHKHS